MLLLQHNWPAPILPFMAERLRRAAEEDGFRFEHRIYDYHDDITLTLSNYEADIIVVDGIADDLMTPEQILAISRCPAPEPQLSADQPDQLRMRRQRGGGREHRELPFPARTP